MKKFEKLVALVEKEQIQRLNESGCGCEANLIHTKVTIKAGRKYTKIDVGSSGKLMIDNVTEEIFGIKAYGQVHKGHKYGILDSINDWNWGDYSPSKKRGLK